MRYEDIPNAGAWKIDAFAIHKAPVDPVVAKIDDMLMKYHQAFSPMAKRNLLADLEKGCAAWKPPRPNYPPVAALEALREVVKRKLAYSGSLAHVYDNVVCISYSIKTGAFEGSSKIVKYKGQLDDEQDMTIRVRQMKTAIQQARNFVPNPARDDRKTLKIFMAPEFYFRGRYGAYPPEIVARIMPLLQQGDDGTARPIFNDWLFIYGTAISAPISARHYCFTCNSEQHIVFERSRQDPGRTVAKCSMGDGHDVQEGNFGATIDNVALIQKGKQDYLVAKEYISEIDFRDKGTGDGAYVKMDHGGSREKFTPLPTEGAVDSAFPARFTDERLGGGVFNFDGITFGMEVCLDHLVGRLQTAENLQFLLIPSAGMSIRMNDLRTIQDGITFNVDGLRADGKVVVRSQAGVSKMPAVHALSGIPGKIEVFGPLAIPYL